jgi:O-antigen/teichoic acid export membrane protein
MFGFLNATLSSGTQRFLTFELGKNDVEKFNRTFSTSLLIHIGLALAVFILAETVGQWFVSNKMNIAADRLYAAGRVYQFSVFAMIVTIIQVPFFAFIIAHERMSVFAYISIVEAVLKLLAVYLLLVISYDKLITYSILIFIITLFIMIFYMLYCMRNYDGSIFSFVWDRDILKSMLGFSGWSIFGVSASIGAVQGINILLNIFFGPIANAARGVSFQVSNAINGFVTNLQMAVTPQITKLYAANEIDELHKLLYENAKYAFLLLWLLSLPVLLEIDLILSWWLKSPPENTALFCILMMIHSLIYVIMRPFIMAIHGVGIMKPINLTAGTVLLLILPVCYLLLKIGYPVYTPFIVYICATLIEFCFELYFLKKYINISIKDLFSYTIYPISKIISVSLLPVIAIFFYLPSGLWRLIFVFAISSMLVVVSTYYIAMDLETRLKFNVVIKEKLAWK